MNKDDFYLKDIELLKQLSPIMAKKGIGADRHLLNDRLFHPDEIVDQIDTGEEPIFVPASHYGIPTWRKDSLEAALYYPKEDSELWEWLCSCGEVKDLLYAIAVNNQGQQTLKALGELVVLLDKEGVE